MHSCQSHEAAMALVRVAVSDAANEQVERSSSQAGDLEGSSISAQPPPSQPTQPQQTQPSSSAAVGSDPDLRRAEELVSLHYNVKIKYRDTGRDPELVRAGDEVERVLYEMARS